MKPQFLFVLLAVLGLFAVFAVVRGKDSSCSQQYRKDLTLSGIGGEPISLESASTALDRQKGLSGIGCLPPDTGMLFVFESSDLHGIWMKDMKFSIDILWLDSSKKVIHIEENVPPESYPKVFYPKNPASYVIELRAGQVTERSINIGQQLNW